MSYMVENLKDSVFLHQGSYLNVLYICVDENINDKYFH